MKQIESIDDLTPDSRNANLGTERGRGMLEQSLREFGAGRSILVDKEGVVIAGNKTLEVAEELGLPIRVVTTNGGELVVVQRQDLDLDDGDKARRLGYMDNRTGQVGLDWDPAQILADLETDVDLGGLWTDAEIAELVAGVMEEPPEDPGPQIDRAEELREKWGVEQGQVWEIGKHRLMCGDSFAESDVRALMGNGRCDMLFTDPPYGIDLDTDYSGMPSRWNDRVLYQGRYSKVIGDQQPFDIRPTLALFKKAKEVFLWGADYYADKLPNVGVGGTWYVWDKREDESGETFDRMLGSPFELCWGKKKRGKKFIRMRWTGLFHGKATEGEQSSGDTRFHPTQKPVALAKWFVEQFSNQSALIVDPFIGVGWTMVAAEQTGRICYGMEIEPKYVAVSLQRLADMGLEPRLVDG